MTYILENKSTGSRDSLSTFLLAFNLYKSYKRKGVKTRLITKAGGCDHG